MNKELAFKDLDELIESFDIEVVKAKNFNNFDSIIQRNFIISYYTIWETYIKYRLYDVYQENEELLYNEVFIKKYFEKVMSKNHISKIFLKKISSSDVQKEILCDSNNLNWNEIENFILLIGFDINILKKNIQEDQGVDAIIKSMSNNGIFPVYKDNNNEQNALMKNVAGYIQYMVDLRNQISHNYNSRIGDVLNKNKITLMIHFLKKIICIIDSFINEEIFERLKNSEYLEGLLDINSVIRGCNTDIENTCVLEVLIPPEGIELPKQLYLKSATGAVEKMDIVSIKCKNVYLRDFFAGKMNSIEVRTTMKVRRGRNLEICARKYVRGKMRIVQTEYTVEGD